MRLIGFSFVGLLLAALSLPRAGKLSEQSNATPAKFSDVMSALGVRFRYQSFHTPRKYLIETMGSGVALFDYDNDGRLDIFLVNGAPLADPTPKGTIPQKTGPQYWNRLFHQKPDGTFEDVTERAGLQGAGYGMGVAVGDYDNDGYEDVFIASGMGFPYFYWRNYLMMNNGDETFTDQSLTAGIEPPVHGVYLPEKIGKKLATRSSRCAAVADFDGDGRLDIITNNFNDHPYYFRNHHPRKNYVAFKLQGRQSNRDAIGATVQARITVLITGFGPFPGVPVNATMRLLPELARAAPKRFPDVQFAVEVLPTEWAAAPRRLQQLLAEVEPDIALHFGVSSRAKRRKRSVALCPA